MSNARRLSTFSQVFPPGIILDYGLTTPPPGWLLCDGSFLGPATAYPDLRNALIADGFPHGSDGSGNPKLPDARGRVTAGKDNMGGSAAGRLTSASGGVDGVTLGASGGNPTHTLTTTQIPAHDHPVYLNDPGHVHGAFRNANQAATAGVGAGGNPNYGSNANTDNASTGITVRSQPSGGGTANKTDTNTGGGSAHPIVQPTLVLNKIIKT